MWINPTNPVVARQPTLINKLNINIQPPASRLDNRLGKEAVSKINQVLGIQGPRVKVTVPS